MLVQALLDNVRDALSDPGEIAWTDPALLSYLNQALLALASVRPDAVIVNAVLTLAAGSQQTLPAGGLRLMSILYNANSGGTPIPPAVRHIERLSLDDVIGSWLTTQPSASCYEYWYDEADPRRFWTNPLQAGVKVTANYAATPATVTDPDTDLTVDATFAPALQEWMLYLAWRRDDETSPNAARSLAHRQSFFDLLGVKAGADAAASPKKTGG